MKKTRDYVKEHFDAHPITERRFVRPAIDLRGGGSLSVQASHFHYCGPRDDVGPWDRVEVMPQGVSGGVPQSWKRYEAGGVYGHVPVSLVNRFIARRGVK